MSVNLRGMIHLEQVEDLLGTVLKTLNNHEQRFNDITRLCESMLTLQAAEKSMSQLQTAVRLLSTRMDSIREAATARIENQIYSAGDLAVLNQREIEDIKSLCSSYAFFADVETKFQHYTNQHAQDFNKLAKESTPIDMTLLLQHGHQEQCQRIENIESRLSSKLDRSELRHLESLSKYLESFASFREDANNQINILKQNYEVLKMQSESQASTIKQLEMQLASATKAIRACAAREDMEDLGYRVESQLQLFDKCASKSVVEEMEKWILNLEVADEKAWGEMRDIRGTVEELESILNLKAYHTDLVKCVRREHFDAVIEALGKDLDLKSTISETDKINASVQNIYDNIHKHERELLIALRFIEWFTNRGDIYEYNMKVIDNHLKNISTSSIPSVGRYQGETSTRFTPLPNPKQPLSRNK